MNIIDSIYFTINNDCTLIIDSIYDFINNDCALTIDSIYITIYKEINNY